jgi:hypothetical protein
MPPIRPELLDELLKDYQKPDDLLGQDGLLQQLTKAESIRSPHLCNNAFRLSYYHPPSTGRS